MSTEDVRSIIISLDLADPEAAPKLDLGDLHPIVAAALMQQALDELDEYREAMTIIHRGQVVREADE